jgi:hypothetical protein
MELMKEIEVFPKMVEGEKLSLYLDKRLGEIEKIIREQNVRINWILARMNKGNGVTGSYSTGLDVENGIVTTVS